jgi:hypothetical protein
MTTHDADAPGPEGTAAPHASDDHVDAHGHDDHGEAQEPLGPIDVRAWGAGLLGVVLGLVVAAAFAATTA